MLLITLIKADHRPPGIERPGIHVQDIFHLRDEGGIGFGRDFPFDFQPRLEFVFLSVRRTVSRAIESTNFNSTSLTASSANVQRSAPCGGGEHVIATNWASATP